jgi:hypothetical protein
MEIVLTVLIGMIGVCYSGTVYLDREPYMRGMILVNFILAVLLGQTAICQFMDHVDLPNLYLMMACCSFVSIFVFTWYVAVCILTERPKLKYWFTAGWACSAITLVLAFIK